VQVDFLSVIERIRVSVNVCVCVCACARAWKGLVQMGLLLVIEYALALSTIIHTCYVQAESYAETSVFESNFFEQYDDFFAGAAPCCVSNRYKEHLVAAPCCVSNRYKEHLVAAPCCGALLRVVGAKHAPWYNISPPPEANPETRRACAGKDEEDRQYLLLNGPNAPSDDDDEISDVDSAAVAVGQAADGEPAAAGGEGAAAAAAGEQEEEEEEEEEEAVDEEVSALVALARQAAKPGEESHSTAGAAPGSCADPPLPRPPASVAVTLMARPADLDDPLVLRQVCGWGSVGVGGVDLLHWDPCAEVCGWGSVGVGGVELLHWDPCADEVELVMR
jgi:hypothetical protein